MKSTALLSSLVILLTLPLTAKDQEESVFTPAELDQMLAPIALYPDALLAQILAASTYPLEVVEASRWSKNNPGLEGAEAVEAVAEKEWDPSVKALVAFPELLARMDENLDWTKAVGDAFLLQDEEVMATVQGLRQKAYEAGNLESLDHLRVERDKEIIVIEPANPKVVYVPYYRTTTVYGGWWWPAHPPVYWGPPPAYHSYYYRDGGTRIVWTSGVYVSPGFFFSTCDWRRRQVIVVDHHHHHHSTQVHHRSSEPDWTRYSGGDRWRHEPVHRRGVRYRGESLTHKYGRTSASTPEERTIASSHTDPMNRSARSIGFRQTSDRFDRGSATTSVAKEVNAPASGSSTRFRQPSGGGISPDRNSPAPAHFERERSRKSAPDRASAASPGEPAPRPSIAPERPQRRIESRRPPAPRREVSGQVSSSRPVVPSQPSAAQSSQGRRAQWSSAGSGESRREASRSRVAERRASMAQNASSSPNRSSDRRGR